MQNEIKNFKNSNEKNYTEKEFSKKVGNYMLAEQIGVGTFSKVTKGIHTLTGEQVAIKILDKSKIKDDIDIIHISREIEILKSISHKNISQLYESISTSHNFYLVLEYIDGGDLGDYISKKISLPENIACRFFRQLISVIEYLNDMGITHRDLKPENILLDSSKKNIKVIDFGLSNYCANNELLKSACGSPCFASPEMLSGKLYQGVTTDLWSAGIVLYSMLVGTLPFDDQELNTLYEHIKIGTFYIPSNLSLESIDFLKRILQVEPDKRINIDEIKKHKWFNIEKNIIYKGIDLTIETFPFNEKIIDYVIKTYYKGNKEINRNNFIKMIQYHACNQYTATYYLVEKNFESNKNNENNKYRKHNILYSEGNSLGNCIIGKLNFDNLNINEKLGKVEYNLNRENKNSINKKTENTNNSKKVNTISKNNKKPDKRIVKENIKQYFQIKQNNKKLSHKISSIYQYLDSVEVSQTNSVKKKPKSWSKKKKNKILSSNNTKRRNHLNIYDNIDNKYKNQNKLFNFQTEIINKNSSNIKKEFNFKKQKELSLMNPSEFTNSVIKNSKIFSIKIVKPNKINKKISKYNTLNKTERNSNCINMMNLSKYNYITTESKEKKPLNIRGKFHKISFNKFQKKIFIKPNINNINQDLNDSPNYYYLTSRNSNKIKIPEANHSLILLKQKYLENQEIKNKTIHKSNNKYKELIDEYNTDSKNNNKQNKKILINNEYFTVCNKSNNKQKHKYETIINSSYNKSSISNAKMLNNKIDNSILKNSVSLSLKNKIFPDIKKNKSKTNKEYKKPNKIINLNLIDNKLSINNNKISKLFYNKLKINSIKEKSKENNQNYSAYIKTEKINYNNKNKNRSENKNISLSPFNKNNYNKTTDNNKIINININNILKIKKQYSLSMAKSNDASKNSINNIKEKNNNQNLLKIKSYFSSIPLSFDKKQKNNKKYIIKHYSRNHRTNIKSDLNNPLISPELKSNKNYSSMLKKQFLEEQLNKKNI